MSPDADGGLVVALYWIRIGIRTGSGSRDHAHKIDPDQSGGGVYPDAGPSCAVLQPDDEDKA